MPGLTWATQSAPRECVIDREIVDELINRPRQSDPLDELTPREREILALIAEGRSNQGICRALKLDIQATQDDNRRVLAVLAHLRH